MKATTGSKSFRLQGDDDMIEGGRVQEKGWSNSSMSSLCQLERLYAILEKAAEYYSARLLMVSTIIPCCF